MPQRPAVISSARLIAACTLLSRITGLVRDMLLMHIFALSWVADAWNFAFQFPNLFRRLFGEGALAAAFVPTFTQTMERDGRESAWALLARTLALLTVALSALIVVLALLLLAFWQLGSADTPEHAQARALLFALTGLMLPFVLTICVVALFSGALNCVGSFAPGALAPLILNLFMIFGIVWLGPRIAAGHGPQREVFGVAIAVLAAGVVQVLVMLPVLRSRGVRLGWKLDVRDQTVVLLLRRLGPVLLGQGVLVLAPLIDSLLCVTLEPTQAILGDQFPYPLQEGALTALANAARLYQFPLGVVAISLAVAALPTLSRLAGRGEWDSWRDEWLRTARLSVFVGLLAGAMMIVVAQPIVRMLFEYHNFTRDNTARVAALVRWYGFGMGAFCLHHIVLRGFYSVGDVRTPLRISCVLLPANIALSLSLVWFDSIREAAFAISSATTSTVAVIVGATLLQRRASVRLLSAPPLTALLRMLLAAASAAGAVVLLRAALLTRLVAALGDAPLSRATDVFGSLAVGVATYLLICTLLKLDEPKLIFHRAAAGKR